MEMTLHARRRWAERFPDRSAEKEFAAAVLRLTKAEFGALRGRSKSERHRRQLTHRRFEGVFFRKTRDGIVFVVEPPDRVVTVFHINPKRMRKIERRIAQQKNNAAAEIGRAAP